MIYPYRNAVTTSGMIEMATAFHNYIEENDNLDYNLETFKAFLGKGSINIGDLYSITMGIIQCASHAIPTENEIVRLAASTDTSDKNDKIPYLEVYLEMSGDKIVKNALPFEGAFKNLSPKSPLKEKLDNSEFKLGWHNFWDIDPLEVEPKSGLTLWELHCVSHIATLEAVEDDGRLLKFTIEPAAEKEFISAMNTLLIGFELTHSFLDDSEGIQRVEYKYIG